MGDVPDSEPLGRDPPGCCGRGAALVVSAELGARQSDGHAVTVPCGQLDITSSADTVSALAGYAGD